MVPDKIADVKIFREYFGKNLNLFPSWFNSILITSLWLLWIWRCYILKIECFFHRRLYCKFYFDCDIAFLIILGFPWKSVSVNSMRWFEIWPGIVTKSKACLLPAFLDILKFTLLAWQKFGGFNPQSFINVFKSNIFIYVSSNI